MMKKNKKKPIKRWGIYRKGGWRTIMIFFDYERARRYVESRPDLEVRKIIG